MEFLWNDSIMDYGSHFSRDKFGTIGYSEGTKGIAW